MTAKRKKKTRRPEMQKTGENFELRTTDSTTDRPKNRQKGAGRREKRRKVHTKGKPRHEREDAAQVWLLFSKETDV